MAMITTFKNINHTLKQSIKRCVHDYIRRKHDCYLIKTKEWNNLNTQLVSANETIKTLRMRISVITKEEREKQQRIKFCHWLDNFVGDKNIDPEQYFEIEGVSGVNLMCYQNVIDGMKGTSTDEQRQIAHMLCKIDMLGGDVQHYLRHLAKAIAI